MRKQPTNLFVALVLGSSGFASLVYEILWVRYFSYLLGGTVISLSMVSAVFLGGLALGYRYLGNLGDKHPRPLHLYILLEAGIALFSLLPMAGNRTLPTLVDPAFLALASTPILLRAFQFLIVCLAVLPSTICMGATVPMILGAFRDPPLARALSGYYFINTLGGALGVFAAVFLLLPELGALHSHFVAMGFSFISALLAFGLSKSIPPAQVPITTEAPQKMKLEKPLAALTFICGFYILAAEILWSRLLMLYLGNTIFAFGIILGVVLLSIAAGSILYRLLPNRRVHSWSFVAILMAIMALSVALPAQYYDQATYLFFQANVLSGDSWSMLMLMQLGVVLLLVGVPTFCSGLFFPMVAGLSTPTDGCRSQVAGRVGFWNTLGTICGSLTAAFWILPQLGLKLGFILLSSGMLVVGLMICINKLGQAKSSATLRWGIILCLLVTLPWLFNRNWDQKMVHSGVYLYSPYYQEVGGLKRGLGEFRLVFSQHDRESSVAITENRQGERSLVINGKVDASSGQDMATQYLLAHLPMLHHTDPQKVMVIGLGSGVTLGSAALYPSSQLDALEISPAVVEASGYFNDFNQQVLADSRVTLILNDGMYYLRTLGKTYDVIISEPSNPWQRGNANLFSDDFYTQVESHLNPGGIFCQWIPLYDLSPEHLKSALATFHAKFENTMLFLNSGDLLVLGSNTTITRPGPGTKIPPAAQQQLRQVGMNDIEGLYQDKFLFRGSRLEPNLAGAEINTLNQSSLEFSAKPLFTSGFVGPYRDVNTRWLKEMM